MSLPVNFFNSILCRVSLFTRFILSHSVSHVHTEMSKEFSVT